MLLKEKNLEREGEITGLLEVNVQGGRLMEIYASIEAFCFAMDVIGLTKRPTIINMLVVIFLQ